MELRKRIGTLAVILTFTISAAAQEAQVITAEPAAPAAELPAVKATNEVAPQPAQVVIIQESAPAQKQVVTQPTTVVEDSPLELSKAEQLRKTRQDAEVETEQKIVEKLEESRLEDEKKRMQNLFGDKLEKKEEAPVEVAPVAAPVVLGPAPAEEPKEELDKEALKAEIAESVKADLSEIKKEEKKDEFKKRMVVGAQLGTIDYEVGGIESDIVGGVTIGYEFRERMELEGGFSYSEHTAFESTPFGTISIQDMEQYNFSVGLRYAVLPYFVSPVVGALASYTHRIYSVPFVGETEVKSDALDAGFLVGVDVLLSQNMSISFDYRRMMNIENRINDNALLSARNYNGFEESDYDMLNLALRFMF